MTHTISDSTKKPTCSAKPEAKDTAGQLYLPAGHACQAVELPDDALLHEHHGCYSTGRAPAAELLKLHTAACCACTAWSAQKHFLWTMDGPDTTYSPLEIHICWNVLGCDAASPGPPRLAAAAAGWLRPAHTHCGPPPEAAAGVDVAAAG